MRYAACCIGLRVIVEPLMSECRANFECQFIMQGDMFIEHHTTL